MLETLFFWNLDSQLRDASLAHTIIIWLTASCVLLSCLEAVSSSDRSASTARFFLCLCMCLQSSWIVHTGLQFLFRVNNCGNLFFFQITIWFQESWDPKQTITVLACHVSVIMVIGVILGLIMNTIVLNHILKRGKE